MTKQPLPASQLSAPVPARQTAGPQPVDLPQASTLLQRQAVTASQVMQLQRAYGNKAVASWLAGSVAQLMDGGTRPQQAEQEGEQEQEEEEAEQIPEDENGISFWAVVDIADQERVGVIEDDDGEQFLMRYVRLLGDPPDSTSLRNLPQQWVDKELVQRATEAEILSWTPKRKMDEEINEFSVIVADGGTSYVGEVVDEDDDGWCLVQLLRRMSDPVGSRRYESDPPEWYSPDRLRSPHHAAKQMLDPKDLLQVPSGPLVLGVPIELQLLHVIEGMLDSLYAGLPLDEKVTLAMESIDANGYGDLLFGLKSTKFLQEKYPQGDIYMVSDKAGHGKVINLKGDEEFGVQVYSESDEIPEPSVIIKAPVLYIPDTPNIAKQKGKPKLRIDEYGRSKTHMTDAHPAKRAPAIDRLASGVYATEVGILIDPTLSEFADMVVNNDVNGEFQASKIGELQDEALRGYLLAERSPDAVLYFGYAHKKDSFKTFLEILSLLEAQGERDVQIVMPGHPDIVKELTPFIGKLFGPGFGTIVLTLAGHPDTLIKTGSSGATLKMICSTSVTHQDMVTLFQASQPFTIITGDQSLSEAVSAGKTFVYEKFEHKVDFFDSLIALAQAESQEMGEIVKVIATGSKTVDIARLLMSGQADEAFAEFGERIRMDHDILDRMSSRVKRLLARKHAPEVVDYEDELRADIWFGTLTAERTARLQSLIEQAWAKVTQALAGEQVIA